MEQQSELDPAAVERHNTEAAEVWRAFRSGRPVRVPVAGGISIRYYLKMRNLSFRRYFTDPAFMMQCQLETQAYNRARITGDLPVGLPEKWDGISVDFQNQYEAGWLGCEIVYPEEDVLWTRPALAEDKGAFDRLKMPDPLTGNLMARMIQYYEFFRERSATERFAGRPVAPPRLPCGTDGPFTLAVSLRGADNLCVDLCEDPEFARALLDFVTEAIIARIRASRELMRESYPAGGCGLPDDAIWFADDAIVLLSPEMYADFVLPCHRRILAAFPRPGAANSIHLCGPIEKYARLLHDELNIRDIETGFFTDFEKLTSELGRAVTYRRTVHPMMLWGKTAAEIDHAAREFIAPWVERGMRLMVRVSNVIAPGTSPENLEKFYRSVKKYGRYEFKH